MNVLLNGANGRMGNEVIKAVENREDFNIVCGFSRNNGEIAFPIYNNINDIKENIDVIIDFSVPAGTFEILKFAKEKRIPTVIATTGFTKEENEKIEEYSKYFPIFKSANMSLDINLMVKIVQEVAKVLSDTDIEIIETHHNRKVDSPSGTAILLADSINKVFENHKEYNFDRMHKKEKRSKNEIGFSSIRGGNVVGDHTVAFFGENETLEITHRAYSREVFVEGTLKAAEYIVNQTPGLYNMEDLLK